MWGLEFFWDLGCSVCCGSSVCFVKGFGVVLAVVLHLCGFVVVVLWVGVVCVCGVVWRCAGAWSWGCLRWGWLCLGGGSWRCLGFFLAFLFC